MWYSLKQKLNEPESSIELKGSYDDFSNFFLNIHSNTKIIDITGIAQEGLSIDDLIILDYLAEIRMPNIPIFSKKFVEQMSDKLNGIVEFYPCKIYHRNKCFNFYIGKILNILPIIDIANSGFRLLTDGSKTLTQPIAINSNISEDKMIVRDDNYLTRYFVSDKFKEIVESRKLQIDFYKVSNSFW